jgi:hypothetical protein
MSYEAVRFVTLETDRSVSSVTNSLAFAERLPSLKPQLC